MKHIAVVTPCYNEVENIAQMAKAVHAVFGSLGNYSYTHLFIDNGSTDGSRKMLRDLASKHDNIASVFNARNFGYTRSAFYGLLLPDADATILLSCDFQEPPEMIVDFLKKWEDGAEVVGGIKTASRENMAKRALRTAYYKIINRMSEVELVDHFFDFGLYDRGVILELRRIPDVNPYLRGLICEFGYEIVQIPFTQQSRKAGRTKFSLGDLIDTAMTGLVNQMRVPLRIVTYLGVVIFMISFIVAIYYFFLKILYWDSFSFGVAPAVLGIFFFGAINLIGIGILAEYIGAIYSQMLRRDLVREFIRLNEDALGFPDRTD